MTGLSVIICAHNPRTDYLRRVLLALQAQTLSPERWELLLIDNASAEPLAERIDLSWHPAARHIREDELGLTAARLRGIAEAKADIPCVRRRRQRSRSRLSSACSRDRARFPFPGAWGASAVAEYESEPPSWATRYLPELVVREVDREVWPSNPNDLASLPAGAGLCVRSAVAAYYVNEVRARPVKQVLDRRGSSLMSGGDVDLVLCCPELKLGFGLFPALRLVHLIPAARFTEAYLSRMVYAKAFSYELLMAGRQRGRRPPLLLPMAIQYCRTYIRWGPRHANIYWSSMLGHRDAFRYFQDGVLPKSLEA